MVVTDVFMCHDLSSDLTTVDINADLGLVSEMADYCLTQRVFKFTAAVDRDSDLNNLDDMLL